MILCLWVYMHVDVICCEAIGGGAKRGVVKEAGVWSLVKGHGGSHTRHTEGLGLDRAEEECGVNKSTQRGVGWGVGGVELDTWNTKDWARTNTKPSSFKHISNKGDCLQRNFVFLFWFDIP